MAFLPLEVELLKASGEGSGGERECVSRLEKYWQRDMQELSGMLELRERSQGLLNRERCFFMVAISHEKVLGFMQLRLRSQEQYFYDLESGDEANVEGSAIFENLTEGEEVYIETIAITPEFARHGIGTGMINSIQNAFPKVKLIYLEVAATNESAIKFYKKLGFQQQGGFSIDCDPHYIYSKVIQK